MPRMERERRHSSLVLVGEQLSAPDDLTAVTGVLITRTSPNDYGVCLGGRWKPISRANWQSRYRTILPGTLRVGQWAVIPELVDRAQGRYIETFGREQLQAALEVSHQQLVLQFERRQPRLVRGLNDGARDTVLV